MISIEDVPHSGIVELTLEGALSRADADSARELMATKLARYQDARALEHVRKLPVFHPPSLWRGWKLTNYTLHHFSRVAVVSDAASISTLGRLVRPLVRAKLRCFREAKLDEARDWLRRACSETTDEPHERLKGLLWIP